MHTAWAGWGTIAIALIVFFLLAWRVQVPDSAVWDFDENVAKRAKTHADAHPRLLDFAVSATDAGGVPVMTALVIIGGLLLWMCGQSKLAALWLSSAALGCAINVTAKSMIDRPRPDESLRDSAVQERNASYPSGHAMGSTITYGALAIVGFALLERRWSKFVLLALVIMLIVTICWTRVYLRAHWCSDVIGGAVIGVGWLAVCFKIWPLPRIR